MAFEAGGGGAVGAVGYGAGEAGGGGGRVVLGDGAGEARRKVVIENVIRRTLFTRITVFAL